MPSDNKGNSKQPAVERKDYGDGVQEVKKPSTHLNSEPNPPPPKPKKK